MTEVGDLYKSATRYTHGALGNRTLTSSPDAGNTVLTFDAADSPATRTDARGKLSPYTYDALGRLVSGRS